jgi:hypothetical protein
LETDVVAVSFKRSARSTKSLVIALLVVLAGLAVATPRATARASELVAFTPLMLTRANSSAVVYVVGSLKCPSVFCLRLLRTSDNGSYFETVSLPPILPNPGSATGTLDRLVFANALDGYALVGGSYSGEGINPPTVLYATFDGAQKWHRVNIAPSVSIFAFEAAAREIYAVTAHCNGTTLPCKDYRLDRSTLAATKWSTRTIPGYTDAEIGLFGAYGSNVWLDVTQLGEIDTSHDHGRTFATSVHRQMGSPGTCDLTATSNTTLWAQCPTGMLADFFISRDGGTRWSSLPVGQYSNTGGGNFDPISNTLAYFDFGPGRKTTRIYRISNAGRVLTAGIVRCAQDLSYVFTDEAHGLAICPKDAGSSFARMLDTSNGGATWNQVRAP